MDFRTKYKVVSRAAETNSRTEKRLLSITANAASDSAIRWSLIQVNVTREISLGLI